MNEEADRTILIVMVAGALAVIAALAALVWWLF